MQKNAVYVLVFIAVVGSAFLGGWYFARHGSLFGGIETGTDPCYRVAVERILQSTRQYYSVREKELAGRARFLDEREGRLRDLESITGKGRAGLVEITRLARETIEAVKD